MGKSNFITPDWFQKYWRPDEESQKYWRWQYELAIAGKEYDLPQWCMRMPTNELHQKMAKDFFF